MNLTWKDVFKSQTIWPADFDQCRERAIECGYKFLAFNGMIFDINDDKTSRVIGLDTELDKEECR